MSGARAQRACFALLLALIGVSMFLLNCHMPLMMDDYDYSFSWSTGERLAGVGDVLASQAAHYRLWGGRSVVHALAQLFLYWGEGVFNVANALMYLVLLLEICALAGRRDGRTLLCAHGLLLLTVPFFGTVFLWLDGACNYLWGTALALVPLLIAKSERGGGFFDADGLRGAPAVPVSFLAGWTNENTACGVLAALLLLLAHDAVKGRRIRPWRAAALAAQALGVAVMLLAPGNFARASEEATRGFLAEMIYRAAVIAWCTLCSAGVVLALGAAVVLFARRRRVALRLERAALPVLAAVLSAGALLGSPQISDRSFTAVAVLCIAALLALCGQIAVSRRAAAGGAAVMALLVALGTAVALRDVTAHEAAWQAQVERIEAAAKAGEAEVTVASVPSTSRFTMEVTLQTDPDAWPNRTLGKYYGIRVRGQ